MNEIIYTRNKTLTNIFTTYAPKM